MGCAGGRDGEIDRRPHPPVVRSVPGVGNVDDKIYCVHETEDVGTIREHARRGGFPADLVVTVAAEIGPETAYV
jgi:hypothetical protein